jgi:hypothetical protein
LYYLVIAIHNYLYLAKARFIPRPKETRVLRAKAIKFVVFYLEFAIILYGKHCKRSV